MFNWFGGLLAVALVAFGTVSPARAAIIVSGAGNETCSSPLVADTSCTTITPHSAWQSNNPTFLGNPTTAQWISFDKTGIGPDTFYVGPSGSPVLTYTLTFDAVGGSQITTKVWADDTAKIFVDGVALNSPDLDPSHNGPCQQPPGPQTPSCTPTGGETFLGTLGAGTVHTLTIEVWQIGTGTTNDSNPVGLLYAGQIEAVPEPATLGLLGVGLIGLGALRRHRIA